MEDFEIDVADGPPAGEPIPGGASPGRPDVPWNPTAPWPGNAPSLELAEEALLAGLDGTPPPIPELGPIASQIANGLSESEVTLLSGRRSGFDGSVARRVAAMRVRVAFAFATAPKAGSESDAGAVAALLGEIDALLAAVNELSADAPADVGAALEGCRNALVRVAIDFSEVAQRFVPVEVAAAPAPAPRATRAAVPRVRVLSDDRATAPVVNRRQRVLLVATALAVLVAAAYHGHRAWVRSRAGAPPPAPEISVPAGMAVAPGSGRGSVLLHPTGEGAGGKDAAAIEKLRETERLKGNEVVELPGGALLVRPERAKE